MTPARGTPDAPLPQLWLTSPGPEEDVVVSSRMRLARNVRGYHFKSRFDEGEDATLETHLRDVLGKACPHLHYLSLTKLPENLREVLFERHIVSHEHVAGGHARGVAFNDDATTSVMVNEEDHLPVQVFSPGLDLDDLGRRLEALDSHLAENLEYSFSPRYGHLTSCPTNTGTGLRVSVMLHLPALSWKPEDGKPGEQGILKVHNAAQKLGLAVRGMHGESSRAEGDFFQISKQVTLGRSPEQSLEDLRGALPRVLEYERNMREILHKDDLHRLEDTVWRAWGTLCHARRIASAEALAHLSSVRLGLYLGVLDGVEGLDAPKIHELMVRMRPGHLQHEAGRPLEPEERDVVRAELLRATLSPARA